jgi:hypothetical protein
MFRAKTVIVVGAGASVEVGLPVGADLLKQIVKLTHITFDFNQQQAGDHMILEALRILMNEGREVQKLHEHLAAGWQLSKSAIQAISIDNVIDALEDPKVELVGKTGIVRAILMAESNSRMFRHSENHPNTINLSNFDETWYSSLTKLLTENVRKSEIDKLFSNVEIINFNYDRCLEHYLPFSLADYYGLNVEDIQQVMKSLVVHRPYGMAGKLPWQHIAGPVVRFGQNSAQLLSEASQQIRTFTERIEENEELKAMKATIANADRIVFLGFAFHRQNVELLAQKVQKHTEIVATSLGISQSDKSVIHDELTKAFAFDGTNCAGRITLADATCNQFFKDYWRTLTAQKSDASPSYNLNNL